MRRVLGGTMSGDAPSKTDLMYEILYNPDFVPLPSPRVHVKAMIADGKSSYLMKNDLTGIYYEPDELTNLIWAAVDGKRNLPEIVREVQRQKPSVQEKTVLGTLLFFAEASLLVSTLESKRKKRFKVVSAFEMDFTLIEHSKHFLQSIHSKMRSILRRPLLWATVIFIVLGAVLFAGQFVSIFGNKSNFEILGSSVVGFFFYYFVALAPVIAIHEIAHGLALVHYGGEPGEMGAGLFYFGPMFYTETTDAWGLEKKHRMMVYLAGNISTLLIGSVVAFALLFVKFPQPAALILTMVAFYSFDMSLFNFAPPFETDGYLILSDALNMPNLRRESYGYVWSLLGRAFGVKPKMKASGLTKRKKWIFAAYAALSVGWIMYIVFQTSLFLTYMSQDVTVALSNVFHALLTSQALPAAAIVIGALSVLYFGMQVLGYGSLFLAAVKRAAKKPLRIEAIPDRTLSVFAYLPPHVPKSLSSKLKTQMERTAKKLVQNFEINQRGCSCAAVLKMGGASLAFTQIKNSLKHVEDDFRTAYGKLILSHEDQLQKSVGIYSSAKMKWTKLLQRVAAESASSGNSGALEVAKAVEEKQKETILYLLSSAFGTVWTIEVQPAHEYEIQKEIVPSMLLEDLTLTDLYGDCENFKKRIIYGYDSLAKLAVDTEIGLRESLAKPQEYQLVGVFEPIKSRVTFVGRTDRLEKKLHLFAPYFVAETWSGYLDNLLTETCYKLHTLNQVRLPPAKAMKEMSIGELAVLVNDLSEFEENQRSVDKNIQESKDSLSRINQSFQEVRNAIKPSENFDIGLLEATFNVNVENLEALPGRIKDFQKGWKALCKELERIRSHVNEEYEKRKAEIGQKRRKILRIYPAIMIISVLLVAFSFLPSFAMFWIAMLSIASLLQVFYWVTFYRIRRSLSGVSKYPSEAFSRIHLLLLAWTEAIYGYITTGDILTPQ
jgi:hypothetical protein